MRITRRSHLFDFTSRLVVVACCTFCSPARAQERVLTLERAVRLALQSPRILAGKETVSQAQADALTASITPNPRLAVEAGMLPLSRRYTVDAPGGPTDFSVGVAYPIDWLLFGKRAAEMAGAEAAVTVTEAEHADLARRRATETTLAFYGVLEAKSLHELSESALAGLEKAEASLVKAVENGGRTKIELSRVRLELLSARRELREAALEVASARATLRSSIGSTSLDGQFDVQGTLDTPLETQPLPIETAVRVAKENRPDLWALRHKATKAERDQTTEGRRAFPDVTLGLGVVHQFQRSVGAPDVTAWGASAEFSLPFTDRNQGNRAKAASLAQQARHELSSAMVDLRAELEQLGEALATSRLNAIETARNALDLASQVRDSTREAYLVGGRTFLEMLDAERAYRDTYRAHITSRAGYLRAVVRYESALGKPIAP